MNDLQIGLENKNNTDVAIGRINNIFTNGLLPAKVLIEKGIEHMRSADPEPMQQLEGIEWKSGNSNDDLYTGLYRNSDISIIKVMMETPGEHDLQTGRGFSLVDTVRKRAASNILVAVPITNEFKPINGLCDSVGPGLINRIYIPQRLFMAVAPSLNKAQLAKLVSVPYITVDFQTRSIVDKLEVPDYYQAVLNDYGNPRQDVWLTGVRMPADL